MAGLAQFWSKNVLLNIMTTCIIMHNIIIENEHNFDILIQEARKAPTLEVEMMVDENIRFH